MEMFIRPNSITAPSSPVHYSVPSTTDRYGGDQYYISAPSSPSQISHFYRDFDDLLLSPSPCDQRKPAAGNHEAEFAFDVNVNVNDDFSNHSVSSADELFHGGVIKPMQIPSREHRSTVSKGKDFLAGALSPRNKKDSSTSLMREKSRNKDKRSPEHDRRGRERIPLISSSSRRSAARSLSPVRVSQYPWEEERQHQHQHQHQEQQQSSANTKPTSSSNNNKSQLSNSGSKGLRKWRLKDFFLFRSASEGRSDNKDPLRKYTFAFRKFEEVKGSSSKINVAESPGSGSGSGSVSKRKGKVSAHELHYTANRAVSEDLKKKTFLPYKQGILGRVAINPAVHGVGNGFGFSKK